MPRHTEFDMNICDVDVTVKASIYNDGEFDEFTVYVGDTVVTEILSDGVVERLKEEARDNVSDETIEADRADDILKDRGE